MNLGFRKEVDRIGGTIFFPFVAFDPERVSIKALRLSLSFLAFYSAFQKQRVQCWFGIACMWFVWIVELVMSNMKVSIQFQYAWLMFNVSM